MRRSRSRLTPSQPGLTAIHRTVGYRPHLFRCSRVSATTAIEAIESTLRGWEEEEPVSTARQIPEGFSSEAEYDRHIDALADDAPGDEIQPEFLAEQAREDILPERLHIEQFQEELARLRADIETVRLRLASITDQSASVVQAHARWLDASAHAQLGPAPWAKLGAAMLATAVATRLFARLPVGAILSALAPIALRKLSQTAPARR
ncbi:hypothetical protein EV561_1803 [Rhizobium sp. BK376]|nr:hypothetical protein EV561_1803 [Rhizobium sp. BK376]